MHIKSLKWGETFNDLVSRPIDRWDMAPSSWQFPDFFNKNMKGCGVNGFPAVLCNLTFVAIWEKKIKTRPQPSSQPCVYTEIHTIPTKHHFDSSMLWSQLSFAAIIPKPLLFSFFMTFLSKFCDEIFFDHEFSSCFIFRLLLSVFDIYESAKEIFSYHHWTLKGTCDGSSLICFSSRSIGADGINWFLLPTFQHFTARLLISDTVVLALTFDLVALSEVVFCCHDTVINMLPVFKKMDFFILSFRLESVVCHVILFIRWQKSYMNLWLRCRFNVAS